jgi:hypothetical protein
MTTTRFRGIHFGKMLFIGIVFIAGFSAIVMLLWNSLLPNIFGIKTISFWQALGVLALTKILFSSFHGRPHAWRWGGFYGHGPLKEKWMNMSEEERKEFINRRREYMHRGYCSDRDYYNVQNPAKGKNESGQSDTKS